MRGLVAALLLLFPAGFRRRFGPEMLATFDRRWQELPGWRLAARTVLDLVFAAAQVRFSRRATPNPQRKGDKLMTLLLQDLRFGVRTLLRSRGFTAVGLLTLALGIGVNTAMFSVAHAVLWRSFPYPHPDRLVTVGEVDAHDPDNYWGASWPNLRDWRSRATSFEHLTGVMNIQHILREGANPMRISGAAVSSDFFRIMGVAPLMGRFFGEAEDRQGVPAVIVLSHRMWTDLLGGDPAVIGRSLRFGQTPYTVIGVMPAGFEYRQAEFWTPLEQEVDDGLRTHRNIWVLDPVGRLRPGVSPAAAAREVEAISAQIRQDHPETRRGLVVRALTLPDALSRDLRPALLVLLGAVGCLLLIACGNIAGLMLVRGTARAREMATRRALGVGYARLLRQLLTESAVLAVAGGTLGIGLALLATRSLELLTRDSRLQNVPIDGSVLTFAAAITVATTILFGIVPAVSAARAGAAEALRGGTRTAGSRKHALAQQTLVILEVALCLTLLAGAGLLLKSFHRLFAVNPGFRAERLVTLRVALPLNYDSDAAVKRFYRQAQEKLSALPGVSAATIASQLPITGGEGNGDIAIEGRPSAEGELGATTFRNVMPNYFDVMDIPLVRGRALEERDETSSLHPVLINEGFARRFWPGVDPIGKRFKVGPRERAPWLTIVGVAGDVRQIGLDSPAPFSTYEPLASSPRSRVELAVRAAGDPGSVLAAVQGALRQLAPGLLIDKVQTMSQRIGQTVASRRLNLLLFELFAGLALLLAAVGLYGVVAYSAGQRSHEFGIRIALGAQRGDVLRLVMGQGLKLALIGAALGMVVTLYVARLISGLLFGVQPGDPSTLFAVAALLLTVALLACAIPAYRATRIAPLEALRNE
ncbi:MAG: ABC transporter permease [Candidatus Sulfopaludibacter sp.]|nr:ABC transporter permease [Candidatus Sulfopaludibacter sp.]